MRIRFHWQNQRFSDSMQLRLRETPEQQWETVSWEWDFLLRILGGLAVTGQFMRDKRWMETEDIILGKAKYEDWRSIYCNVWSRPETAEYMIWKVTADEDEARERIQQTVAWQETHDAWLVYERSSGQAIGFAGVEETGQHIYHETGIALGPEYVGRGYGKQILCLLMEYCVSLGGQEFYYSTRSGNLASKALALSCGLVYQHSEQKTDQRSGKTYELEIYKKNLKCTGSEIE